MKFLDTRARQSETVSFEEAKALLGLSEDRLRSARSR